MGKPDLETCAFAISQSKLKCFDIFWKFNQILVEQALHGVSSSLPAHVSLYVLSNSCAVARKAFN